MELWTKLLEQSFNEVENEVVRRLRTSEPLYIQLGKQRMLLSQKYPVIQHVCEGSRGLFLNEEEFGAWLESQSLWYELEQMERRAIYLQGHADCYSYLRKIGAV